MRLRSCRGAVLRAAVVSCRAQFGADGVKSNRRVDEYQLLVEISVYYVTWGVLAYVLTLGKASSGARSCIFTGQIVMLVLEVSLMLQELKLPQWFLPRATEHEMVWLLHEIFPAYMNGCRCLGSFLFVDTAEQTKQMLLALGEQHKEIVVALRGLQAQVGFGLVRTTSTTRRGVSSRPDDLVDLVSAFTPTPTTRHTVVAPPNTQLVVAAGSAAGAAALAKSGEGGDDTGAAMAPLVGAGGAAMAGLLAARGAPAAKLKEVCCVWCVCVCVVLEERRCVCCVCVLCVCCPRNGRARLVARARRGSSSSRRARPAPSRRGTAGVSA